uniref:Crystallin beta gamma X n=1 Tax=Cyprinodon variegatus TaxID=28743 RepID=A0A3Q2FVF3_CYPVA
MNIFTKVPGLAQQTSKLGSVLQRAFYGSSGRVSPSSQRNFTGRRLDLNYDCPRISDKNFPERCNSVQVDNGAWVGFEHENYRGRQYLWDMSDRGEYNCCDRWCAQVDHVSSVRSVKQDNNPPRAQLFERAGFSGKKMEIQDDIPNLLSRYNLNREPNYRGPHYVLEKRDYNNFSDWGSQNSTVGSMRRVRFN